MHARHKQAMEAYQRVHDFVERNPLQPPASYAGAKELLDEVVSELAKHATNQVGGRRAGRAETVRQRALVRRLREIHLRPISKIARAVLHDAPGIEVALRLPSRTLSVTRLIAEARAMRQEVVAHEPVFVRSGRPADFLAQLDAAIEAVVRSQAGRAASIGRGAGAGQGIKQQVAKGRMAVEMIDAIVTTHFAGQLDILGEWRSARRVQLLPVVGASDPEDADAPPSAA